MIEANYKNEEKVFLERLYYAQAIDPIHVGTGGYRLSDVDQTIVRDPGTEIPKIPGSSIEGTARAYTYLWYKNNSKIVDADDNLQIDKPTINLDTQELLDGRVCAGKGGDDGSGHCGRINCPVCMPYGFTIGPENRSFHGMAQFHDAMILFFPVNSFLGPLWVTSPSTLNEVLLNKEKIEVEPEEAAIHEKIKKSNGADVNFINLGWTSLSVSSQRLNISVKHFVDFPEQLEYILSRLVIVSEKLFSQIINSNLEVRTSVSINPETGAADDGSLFTYEAIPRSTVFYLPMVYLNPQNYKFPQKNGEDITLQAFTEKYNARTVEENVLNGLSYFPAMGVGGMNTRGFGRMKVFTEKYENGGRL